MCLCAHVCVSGCFLCLCFFEWLCLPFRVCVCVCVCVCVSACASAEGCVLCSVGTGRRAGGWCGNNAPTLPKRHGRWVMGTRRPHCILVALGTEASAQPPPSGFRARMAAPPHRPHGLHPAGSTLAALCMTLSSSPCLLPDRPEFWGRTAGPQGQPYTVRGMATAQHLPCSLPASPPSSPCSDSRPASPSGPLNNSDGRITLQARPV